jgi:hypothetical protein
MSPTTLGLSLLNLKPMKFPLPSGQLFYMDFKYSDKLRERRLKLDKIYEQIKNKQNGNIK